jgi:BirA family biotin operon repressor/biotin-[acetyl-CoA-carboxylase] ligase
MKNQLACQSVLEFEEVTSTNSVAEMLLADGKPLEGSVITAKFQHGGQGMGTNTWESRMGENLLMSMIVYPTFIRPDQQFLLHKISSLAVMNTVKHFTHSEDVSIKWPNDIYAGKSKIAGILTKNVISGNVINSSIIGIGLNVNQVLFSNHLPNPVSMKMIKGEGFDIKRVREQLCKDFNRYYTKMQQGKFVELDDLYLHALLNHQVESRYKVGSEIFTGIIEGLTEFGRLKVRHGGKIREFDIKEIEYLW